MNRFEKLAATMRDAVEHPDRYPETEGAVRKENGEKQSATFSSHQRGMKPVSGADAMARWQRENEDGHKESRVDQLRKKYMEQP